MALHFGMTADNRNFMSAIHEITSGVQDATRQIEASGGSIDRVISMIKTGVASLGIGLGFKELVGQITGTRDEFQKLEIAFTTFLESEQEANKLMQQMVHTAAITPFDLAGVADGAKNLLAFGVQAEDVNKTIISLGDVAAGLSQPLGDIIYLYGTTIAKPKMDTQDLMQFMGRGIPIAKELAKQFGVAENKVRDLISAGKVTGDHVKKAFESMTGEGSMFGGLMEAQSKSIGGQIANIEDAIDEMFNEIGKSSEGIINLSLEATSSIVENWRSVLLILSEVAVAYGAQKAWLAFDTAFTRSATNYGYDVELEQLRALIPAKEEEAKTALQQAVASGNLSEAKAAEIMALREEANAQLEALTAKETAAKAEESAAIARVKAAQEEVEAINEEIEATWDRITAGMEALTAEERETAATELDTLETMRNEAANIANAASEEARAAAINSAAASEARETLQTQINTAETAGNTGATNLLTIAKEKLALAIAKVNTVIDANKIAIVTGAIIALGYAVYKLYTYQSEEEIMALRVKEATDKVNISYGEEKNKLDELKRQLESSAKGSDKWKAAKDALISQYGQYDSKLGAEIDRVGTLATVYNNLTIAIRKSIAAKGLKDFHDSNDKSGEREKDFSEWYENELKGKFGDNTEKVLRPILEDFAKSADSSDKLTAHVYSQLISKFGTEKGGKLYNLVENDIKKLKTGDLTRMHRESRSEKLALDSYMEANGIDKDTANEVLYGITPAKPQSDKHDYEYWSNQKKDAETRLKALSDIEAAGKKGEKIKNEIKAIDKKLNDAYSTKTPKSKTKSGPTAAQIESKVENQEGKIQDLIRKQAEERLRIEQDYEFERWQTRVDMMDEGEAKVLEAERLSFAKERTELERRQKAEEEAELQRQMALFNAEQDKLAAGNKKYAKKIFRDSDINQEEFDKITERYKKLNEDLNATQQKAETERLQASKEAMNNYLKEFGSYGEKRKAITEEYEKKISEARNEGERMQLTAQRDKALADLDYSEWVDTGAIALAFGDISKLSDKTVKRLIEDMERYREKMVATFDPDKIEKYEEALSGLRKMQGEKAFGVISSYVPDYFKDRKQTAERKESAAENLISLNNKRNELLMRKKMLTDSKDFNKENGHNTGKFEKELLEVNVALDANDQAVKKSKNAFELLQEEWDSLETPQAKFEALLGAISSAADLIGGLASDAASMAEALGAEGLGEALGYLGDAMGSVENIANGFANGGLIGGIAAAAGEIMSWIGKIFSAKDNRHQKNIEALQEQIDALEKSYDRLGEAIDKAYSTDASGLIDQQNELLEQQLTLIDAQIAEEKAKKKTDDKKIKEYKEQREEIAKTISDNKEAAKDAIIGSDIKSAIDEFAQLYTDAWASGRNAAEKTTAAVKNLITSALTESLKSGIAPAVEGFRNRLAEAMADGVLTPEELDELDALKKGIDEIAAAHEEQYKMIEARYKDLDELREEMTDISFDSVRDNFKSLLSDMTSTTADFTDNFSEMLRNALIEGLMSSKYEKLLDEWYKEFAASMEDGSLTDSERDGLRQKYDAIVQQGLADRDAVNDIVGGGAYSQSATTGGWAAMGQDTAEELNGRFTALCELNAINNTLTAEGNQLGAQILETMRSMSALMMSGGDDSTLREIRDMMFLSTGHLEDISKYTRQLVTIREGIERLNEMINQRL